MTNRNPIHMLREEVFGDGQEQRTLIFSYGSAELLRQAKLDGMQARINQKMAEAKMARGEDPTALKGGVPDIDLNSLTTALTGDQTQFASLVVPPELKDDGEERRGSSRLILSGQKKDLAKVGDQQKARGDVGFGVADEAPPPAPKPKRSPSAPPARPAGKKAAPPRDLLMEQLYQGLTPFVPVPAPQHTLSRSQSNALTSTAKVIEEVLHEYHKTLPPRRVVAAPSTSDDGPSSSPGKASAARRPSSASMASMGGRGGGGRRESGDSTSGGIYIRTVKVRRSEAAGRAHCLPAWLTTGWGGRGGSSWRQPFVLAHMQAAMCGVFGEQL